MRLNLYWRGIDLIDVEVHLFRPRQDDVEDEPGELGTTSGQFELAEPLEQPDTRVRIGFR